MIIHKTGRIFIIEKKSKKTLIAKHPMRLFTLLYIVCLFKTVSFQQPIDYHGSDGDHCDDYNRDCAAIAQFVKIE
jgi:hypothetical protein